VAIERIELPFTSERDISSRSADVRASLERQRGAGGIPPVAANTPVTDEWFRSNSWAISRREFPFLQRSHIKALWLSE
jgi:hypothetical protein